MRAGVGPVDLAAAVQVVALVLDGLPVQVQVVGLDGRGVCSFESESAAVAVTVQLGSADDVDQVGDLLGLGEGVTRANYTRAGDWLPPGLSGLDGVFLHVFGPARQAAPMAGVA